MVWSVSQPRLILVTPARQAPLSMGFPRQEYWSGLLCPLPGDLPNPGIKPVSPACPALAGGLASGFFTSEPWENPSIHMCVCVCIDMYSFSDSFPL